MLGKNLTHTPKKNASYATVSECYGIIQYPLRQAKHDLGSGNRSLTKTEQILQPKIATITSLLSGKS